MGRAFQRAFVDGVRIISETLPSDLPRTPSDVAGYARGRVSWWRDRNPSFSQVESADSKTLTEFLDLLSTNYVVVVPVRKETTTFVLSYDYKGSHAPVASKKTRRSSSLKYLLRSALGTRSPAAEIDISAARISQSYHLTLGVGKNNFFASAILYDMTGKRLTKAPAGPFAVGQTYFRRSPVGLDRLHLYTRGFDLLPYGAHLRLRVHEVPWASLLRSFLFSLASLALAWLLVKWNGGTPETDTVATLIGLPAAVVGTYMAVRPPSTRGQKATAAVSTVIFFLSAAALLVVTLSVLDKSAGWFHGVPGLFTHWGWLVNILLGITDAGVGRVAVRAQLVLTSFAFMTVLVRTWS